MKGCCLDYGVEVETVSMATAASQNDEMMWVNTFSTLQLQMGRGRTPGVLHVAGVEQTSGGVGCRFIGVRHTRTWNGGPQGVGLS